MHVIFDPDLKLRAQQDITRSLDEHEAYLEDQEAKFIANPKDFSEELRNLIQSGGSQCGENLPWSDVSHVQRLRKGELSVWGGINGYGKTQLLSQIMLWRMQNQKVLIASLEMKPAQTLYRMACQYAGCKVSLEYAQTCLEKFTGRLWIYDQLDTVESKRILALVHYAAVERGIDHIVIDSLMKCGFDWEDYAAEKRFVDKLQSMVKNLDIHVHLVAHARKVDESRRITKFDLSGGAYLSNIPDNIFLVHRNLEREKVLQKLDSGVAECQLSERENNLIQNPGVVLEIAKNRNGEKTGNIGLYFHKESGQYMRYDSTTAMPPPF